MAQAARDNGRILMEAFHYRYHPLAQRMADIVASGVLGEIRHIQSTMCFPLPLFNDIRYNFALAGGAMMDAGCYAVHMGAVGRRSRPRGRLSCAYVTRLEYRPGYGGANSASNRARPARSPSRCGPGSC